MCIAILVQATLCMLWPGGVLATMNHPVPFITSISPVSAAPGGAQFTLTVNGVNFIAASTVNWRNTPLSTTFVSSRKLTATVTAGLIADGGTGWITVTSPPLGGGTSNVLYLPVANSVSTIKMTSLSSTVGSSPLGVAEGDFNEDGILDLAVSNDGSGTVTILLGNGDGTFVSHGTYAVGAAPLGVTVADVNGDGHLDLVVGHDTNLGPSVLLGDGTGTFVLQAALSVIANPERPMVADIDHDGRLDIVVGSFSGTGVYFYKGNGDGTFQTAVNIGGASTTFDVAIGDVNEDGNLDIVASHEGTTNSMDIFLGNGNGTFQEPAVSTPIPLGWSIALADLNHDGHLDIVISSRSNGGIVAMLGNGDGTFQAPVVVVASGSYQAITSGDLNDDGKPDIVGASNSTLQFIPGNGDGTFQAVQSLGTIGTTYGLVLGNFAIGGGLGVGAAGSNTTFDVFLQTVSLSPSPVSFGNVGVGTASTAQTVTVTNNTSSTVTISGISLTGTNAADFSRINGCTTPLVSAATCTVQVTFTPGAAGARNAVLNVADNAPASPQTVALSGTGVAAPVVMLAPAGLVFPAQPLGIASSAQTVTLSNSGNAALNSISVSITGTNSEDFGQTNTCGTTVAASANCTISVRFTPSQLGAESASLKIADNAAGTPQASR
jgi:FG-GAP-like repeat/Abnormal spindle-like microcephaly-assoc'd, ASPM-SPD-2-Hydin